MDGRGHGDISVTRASQRRRAGASPVDDGHALVDAMVALLIISTTIVLTLHALGTARRAAMAADEVQRAHTLLNHLMLSAPRQYEAANGQTDGFAWTVETTPTGAEAPVEVCRRFVRAVHPTSKRVYAFSTLETCPAPEEAA